MQNPPASVLVPAAQYLRMSTDRQEYSIANQAAAIQKYAESRRFEIVQTYSDPASSGVLFKKRKALKELIQDVVQGAVSYRAILVYDVSRWGRFQDTDESAYYEFLCKASGVPVHYCAETFVNDDNTANLIMKSLKRVMAGEYSRELGIKVAAGQQRGATLGFRQGGQPGYGLRRLLVSADGKPKQVLADGERKSLITDRVILIPGPDSEVSRVREIYETFINKRICFTEIARDLNRRNISYIEGSEWSGRAVQKILTHPKYMGCHVWGQQTQKMYSNRVPKPRSEWTFTPGAFTPLVDEASFAKAQQIIADRDAALPRHKTDEELLDTLRALLAEHGKITSTFIQKASRTHSVRTYYQRFGTVSQAYKRIGYEGFWRDGWLDRQRRIRQLRSDLMRQIVELHPGQVSVDRYEGSRRRILRMQDGTPVSVVASRQVPGYKNAIRWLLRNRTAEYHLITLLARLNRQGDAFTDIYVLPRPRTKQWYILSESDVRLHAAVKLGKLTDFCAAVEHVASPSASFG